MTDCCIRQLQSCYKTPDLRVDYEVIVDWSKPYDVSLGVRWKKRVSIYIGIYEGCSGVEQVVKRQDVRSAGNCDVGTLFLEDLATVELKEGVVGANGYDEISVVSQIGFNCIVISCGVGEGIGVNDSGSELL